MNNSTNKKNFYFTFLLFISVIVKAQTNIIVFGKIINFYTKEPLENVSLEILNLKSAITSTDEYGIFRFTSISENDNKKSLYLVCRKKGWRIYDGKSWKDYYEIKPKEIDKIHVIALREVKKQSNEFSISDFHEEIENNTNAKKPYTQIYSLKFQNQYEDNKNIINNQTLQTIEKSYDIQNKETKSIEFYRIQIFSNRDPVNINTIRALQTRYNISIIEKINPQSEFKYCYQSQFKYLSRQAAEKALKEFKIKGCQNCWLVKYQLDEVKR